MTHKISLLFDSLAQIDIKITINYNEEKALGRKDTKCSTRTLSNPTRQQPMDLNIVSNDELIPCYGSLK